MAAKPLCVQGARAVREHEVALAWRRLTLLQGLPRESTVFSSWVSLLISGCFVFGLFFDGRRAQDEAAVRQRTDCTSTNGLVAPAGADPDTNRSAGLHSFREVGHDRRPMGLVEFTGCRSDLSSIFESTSSVERTDSVSG